jgi:formylglycine-generating enzyme required for sulfatase activity
MNRPAVFTLFAGLIALSVFLAVLLAQEPQRQGRKYALLIGVQKYDGTGLQSLKFCENDVTELAQVLRGEGYGYNRVVLLTRTEAQKNIDRDDILPTAENIRDHLRAILRDRRPEDTVLIAFAGHGVQLKKDGHMYFCPAKCNLDKADTLIGLDDLYAQLRECKANEKILLVDACRNDPLDKRGEDDRLGSVTRPLVPDPPGGTVAIFSCSKGQTARENEKHGHGYLFKYVIDGLKGNSQALNERTGEVTWLKLAGYVTEEVKDAVKEDYGPRAEQVPEVRGEARGLVLGRVNNLKAELLDCTGPEGVSPEGVRKAQEAWAKALGRKVEEEVEVGGGVKMKFVLIPPGRFRMGSPEGEEGHSKEEQLHTVRLTKPFYLGKYPVTQAQYKALTGENPSHFKGEDLPVEEVTWIDCDGFGKKMTERRKDGSLYRLPTEAEWEYSCRGGRAVSMAFGIGDGKSLNSSQANFDGNYPYGGASKGVYREKTTPVGNFQANVFGLYDMHGNVWQWCGDWYAEYAGDVADPIGPPEGSYRVRRGGSWRGFAWRCRSAFRDGRDPSDRFSSLGFRLARVPSGQ